jgi:hypothetical protein
MTVIRAEPPMSDEPRPREDPGRTNMSNPRAGLLALAAIAMLLSGQGKQAR